MSGKTLLQARELVKQTGVLTAAACPPQASVQENLDAGSDIQCQRQFKPKLVKSVYAPAPLLKAL